MNYIADISTSSHMLLGCEEDEEDLVCASKMINKELEVSVDRAL